MKLNFRHKKVNLPKLQSKLPNQGQQLISNINQSGSKLKHASVIQSNAKLLSQSRSAFRVQLDHTKQNYIDNVADTIHLIGQQYITHLNQGKEQRFRATILASLTKLEARDRKIVYQYAFTQNNATSSASNNASNTTSNNSSNNSSNNQIIFDFDRDEDKFREWLGQMHFKIVSTSFDYLINKYLTYQQVKVYCSQNLLLNIILFLQKVQSNILNISLPLLMYFIDQTLKQNLDYLMVKYPQVKQMKPNKRLRAQVQPINNIENDNNDMFQHADIKFQWNQLGDYNTEIMTFINYLIQKMNQEMDFQGAKMTYAEAFYQIMEQVFHSVYLPESYQRKLDKTKTKQQQKKKVNQLFQTNKQVKQYRQKVIKYTSYRIGTKINPNTQLFNQSQLKSGFFQVKSTSILRMLTKWIQQLQKKIFQAKEYIHKRSFRFKTNSKSFSKLSASQKNDLYIQATKLVDNLKRYISNIRSNALSIQGQLAMTMKRKKDRLNIPRHQYLVGQFSSKLEDAASSSLMSYLNQIIHILLTIPRNVRPKYEHDQDLMKEMDINLITFKISDLLRCKIHSHQTEILRIYRQIKRISDRTSYFKIVRIKDRLELGTRDILINVNFKDTFLCEIQLSVTDEVDQKQQAFDSFNHYLYQIRRSNLGPIMQSACIWAHFDQRSRVYKKIKQQQLQQYFLSQTNAYSSHNCKSELINNYLPFVCSICMKFYFSQQGIISHKKCMQCNKYYQCALCLQNRMNTNQLKKFLGLDIILGVFQPDFVQWNQQQMPKHGLIIPKKNKLIQVFFFVTILWKQDAYIIKAVENLKTFQKTVEIITKVPGNQSRQWKKLKQNFIIYEWKQKRNCNQTMTPHSMLQQARRQLQKKQKLQQIKREKKQKQIQEIKDKWKIKKTKKSRPGSGDSKNSKNSKNSKKSKNSQVSKLSHEQKLVGKNKINPSMQKRPYGAQLAPVQEQRKYYNQQIAKRSQKNIFRIAKKDLGQEDSRETHILVLGPFFFEKDIRDQLKKQSNYKVIRDNLEQKMQVLFLQDLSIENEMNFTDKQKQKYANSLSKINQIYLDSNSISQVSFLSCMPGLKIVHLNFNKFQQMTSFADLPNLTQLMLEYNQITNIDGLGQKTNGYKEVALSELNLNHNLIDSMDGLERLVNLEILQLSNNQIKSIQGIAQLKYIKKLDLSYNRIKVIQQLDNLTLLEQLDLSDNDIVKIQGFSRLTLLKKLNLKKNRIKAIQNLSQLQHLKHLDLHRNFIRKIQNLDELHSLIYLNLASNNIRKIQGFKQTLHLCQLDLSFNEISSMQPLIDTTLNNLTKLDLSYNGIKSLLGELFKILPQLQVFYINSNPLKRTPKQLRIYQKLKNLFFTKHKFTFDVIKDHQQDTKQSESQEDQYNFNARTEKRTKTQINQTNKQIQEEFVQAHEQLQRPNQTSEDEDQY